MKVLNLTSFQSGHQKCFLFLLFTIVLIFGLSACDKGADTEKKTETITEKKTETITESNTYGTIVHPKRISVEATIAKVKKDGSKWDLLDSNPELNGYLLYIEIGKNNDPVRFEITKERTAITLDLNLGDFLYAELWDDDTVGKDSIGEGYLQYDGKNQQRITLKNGMLLFVYKGISAGLDTRLDKKLFSKNQLLFEENEAEQKKIKNIIFKHKYEKIGQIKSEIESIKEQIEISSNQVKVRALKKQLSGLTKELSKYKGTQMNNVNYTDYLYMTENPENFPLVPINDWVAVVSSVWVDKDDNDIVGVELVSKNFYLIRTISKDLKENIRYYSRGDVVKFDAMLFTDYRDGFSQPLWGAIAERMSNDNANEKQTKILDKVSSISENLNKEFDDRTQKYPILKTKSQDEFISALAAYSSNSEMDLSYENELKAKVKAIENEVNGILSGIKRNPIKYSGLNMWNNLKEKNFIAFRENYINELMNYKPKSWIGSVQKVSIEEETEVITDWSNVGKTALDVAISVGLGRLSPDAMETYVDGTEGDRDKRSYKKEKYFEKYYIYVNYNKFTWKLLVDDDDMEKLAKIHQGDQITYDGRIIGVDNHGYILVKINDIDLI